MKRWTVVALVCLLAAAAGAQDAERTRLAEELLGAMNMQKTIEESFAAVKQMVPMQLKQMGVSAGDSAEAKQVMEQTMNMVMAELSWDNLKGSYVAIYAETFTADELKGIMAFYKSPAGRSFIEKTPELTRRSMQVSQQMMMGIMPKIQQIAQEAAAKKKAESTD